MADSDRSSLTAEQPLHSHIRLLRVSRHAIIPSQSLPDRIEPPKSIWPTRILSGLGRWWSNDKKNIEAIPSRTIVVSTVGTDVAILDGHQIAFLSSVDGFQHVSWANAGVIEAGFFKCGVWLEAHRLFAVVTSSNCLIIMNHRGKIISQLLSDWWKIDGHPLAIWAKQTDNRGGGESYLLAILASDCSIGRMEYGPDGFREIGVGPFSHTLMKKYHPVGISGLAYSSSESILALAGASDMKSLLKSSGSFCITLWRIDDFWQSADFLGQVNEIGRANPLSNRNSSNLLKLIMSPSCCYIGLLDFERRLQLFEVNLCSDRKLEKLDPTLEVADDIGESGVVRGGLKLNFPYFEVMHDNESRKGTDFDSLQDIEDVCWWDDNTLFLIKPGGLLVTASVPDRHVFSKFCSGIVYDRTLCNSMCMDFGQQRCIFMLESILDKPQVQNEIIESTVEPRRLGWRFLRMQEYTVSQLYNKLLEDAEFDFALHLADKYKLDINSIYKTQWLLSDMSLEAVQQVLPKITDRIWVLKECLGKVTPSMEAMQALLRHGLALVDSAVDPLHLEQAWEDPIIRQFCFIRLRLLQYSDRLETYLGLSMGRYISKDFEVFRTSTLADVSVKLAELGKIGALSLLYKRHAYSLSMSLFIILDALPETLSPQQYAHILPSSNPSTPQIVGREIDWVEKEILIDILMKYNTETNDDSPVHLIDSTEHMIKLHIGFVYPSEAEIVEWYKRRASTMDEVSGQLENALTLIDLGKHNKGILGLEDLWDDLSSLHWVTYNNSETDENEDNSWSLEGWQQLTDYAKFQAMLNGASESSVIDRLTEKAIPFMNQKMSRTLDYQDKELSFIVKWMKELASKNHLNICAVVLTEACKEINSSRLFKSDVECINTALDCIYACSAVDQWDTMERILAHISRSCTQLQSNRSEDQSSGLKQSGKSTPRVVPFSMYSKSTDNTSKSNAGVGSMEEKVYATLGRRIHKAMGHVDAGRMLFNYQVPKSMSFLENAQNDERSVKSLILLMLSKFAYRQPPRSDAEWATLWDHMQRLQAKAFTFLNRQFLFMEYYSTLLKAGKFSLAKSQLKTLGNNSLPPEKIESVIIKVSRDYLFSASSLDSLEIEKARSCLNVIPKSKNIALELDYIDTLAVKLPSLGVHMLPIQVKQTRDPMEIVRKALIGSSTQGELQVDDILDIARSLGLDSNDEIDEVKEAIARQAAASGQIDLALHLCRDLMRRGHKSIWELCAAIARGPELEEINVQLRKELLGFAISHCDDSSISQLLGTWKELDLSERCIRVKDAVRESPYSNYACKADLPQQDDHLPEYLMELLRKVTHLDGDNSLQPPKFSPHILCSHFPWLLQAAAMDLSESGDWQEKHIDLVTDALTTVLLGLAHNSLNAKDELVCKLAQMFLSKFSKELVGLGCLFNLQDSRKAIKLLSDEIDKGKDLRRTFKILSLAFKFALLLEEEDDVNFTVDPMARRERLITLLKELDCNAVSGMTSEHSSSSVDAGLSQWKTRILKDLKCARHSLELSPIVANFDIDRFQTGDEGYIEDVIESILKSSSTPEVHMSKEQSSRVYQYQELKQSCTIESNQNQCLNLFVLETNFKLFERYLKQLDSMERWLAMQKFMDATAKVVLKQMGESFDDSRCRERLCSLLHFWIIVLDSLVNEEPKGAVSVKATRAGLELKACCEGFQKIISSNLVSGSLSLEVIARFIDSPSHEGERLRFLHAMISSGCSFRAVLSVWQHLLKKLENHTAGIDDPIDISALYVQVVSSSINTCSVFGQSLSSFDECVSHFEPVLKAVVSLSNGFECNDENLQESGITSIHEVRLNVWKTICGFAENLSIPSSLRVWLLKLRELIASGHQQKGLLHGFDFHLRNFDVTWIGWDALVLKGQGTPPLKHTIIALKSTELLSTAWKDCIIDANDLFSLETAISALNKLTLRVTNARDAYLLVRMLEEWGDIFGWENSEGENLEVKPLVEENAHINNGWDDGDGWDNIWDESEGVTESGNVVESDLRLVNALHTCWKSALVKLASFKEVDLIVQSLDRAHLRNGRTILTREENHELVSLILEEDPISALKVSLLLPYEDCQDLALTCLGSKIKSTMSCKEDNGSRQIVPIDDCLLVLVLASRRFSTWADDEKFTPIFSRLTHLLSSMIQRGQFSSNFVRYTVLPFFVASLISTSKYKIAAALALQSMRVHPAFMTWNGAYLSVRKFLEFSAFPPSETSDLAVADLKPFSCISSSVQYLQTQLQKTLNTAVQYLSSAYV
ncbi:hypothetical protein KP509_31G017900 [Ceratopteris richardii]|uniref:KNTC1 first ARM-repeats domain-containing protein n=1 Tax=Ceratopteris richardii TaxID=49495 RepID=A0A8T2QW70_CERRI|nr:hypothetical protein KP509_31G017900 [Ceratopteris richardii]